MSHTIERSTSTDQKVIEVILHSPDDAETIRRNIGVIFSNVITVKVKNRYPDRHFTTVHIICASGIGHAALSAMEFYIRRLTEEHDMEVRSID